MRVAEPTLAALPNPVLRYLAATRPAFLSVTLVACLLGLAVAHASGVKLALPAALLTVLFALVAHAGANVINDYYDALNGSDAANEQRVFPFTGGSRFIQNGVLSQRETARFGYGLLAAVVPAGLWLSLGAGPGLIVIGLAGLLLGWAYSAPPFELAGRGLGEPAIGASWLLVIVGADFVQRGAYFASGENQFVVAPALATLEGVEVVPERIPRSIQFSQGRTDARHGCWVELALVRAGGTDDRGSDSDVLLESCDHRQIAHGGGRRQGAVCLQVPASQRCLESTWPRPLAVLVCEGRWPPVLQRRTSEALYRPNAFPRVARPHQGVSSRAALTGVASALQVRDVRVKGDSHAVGGDVEHVHEPSSGGLGVELAGPGRRGGGMLAGLDEVGRTRQRGRDARQVRVSIASTGPAGVLMCAVKAVRQVGDAIHALVVGRVRDGRPQVSCGFDDFPVGAHARLGQVRPVLPQRGPRGQVSVQEQFADAAEIYGVFVGDHWRVSRTRSQMSTITREAPIGSSSIGWRRVAASAAAISSAMLIDSVRGSRTTSSRR